MEYIIKPRAYGKSTDLVQCAAHTGTPILVFHKAMPNIYKMRCEELGIDPNKIKTILWEDIKNNKVNIEPNTEILIDEVSAFLEMILSEYNLIPTVGTLSIDNTPHSIQGSKKLWNDAIGTKKED